MSVNFDQIRKNKGYGALAHMMQVDLNDVINEGQRDLIPEIIAMADFLAEERFKRYGYLALKTLEIITARTNFKSDAYADTLYDVVDKHQKNPMPINQDPGNGWANFFSLLQKKRQQQIHGAPDITSSTFAQAQAQAMPSEKPAWPAQFKRRKKSLVFKTHPDIAS